MKTKKWRTFHPGFTLGTTGFSRVQRKFLLLAEDLTETGNRARKISGTQGNTFHSFQEQEIGEIIAKNMARTARTQLEGRHLLF